MRAPRKDSFSIALAVVASLLLLLGLVLFTRATR